MDFYYFNPGIIITAFVLAFAGTIVVSYFMLCDKNKHKFTGGLAALSDFFNYKKYWIPYFIKVASAFASIYFFVMGLGLLFQNFLFGLMVMVLGVFSVRLSTELIMALYDIRANLSKIANKDACTDENCAEEKCCCGCDCECEEETKEEKQEK